MKEKQYRLVIDRSLDPTGLLTDILCDILTRLDPCKNRPQVWGISPQDKEVEIRFRLPSDLVQFFEVISSDRELQRRVV